MPTSRKGGGSSKRTKPAGRPGQASRQPGAGRPGTGANRQAAREAARAAAREAAEREAARQQRIRRATIVVGAAALVVVVAVVSFLVFRGDGKKPTAASTPTASAAPGVASWPAPAAADVPGLVRTAGLELLPAEGTTVHFHTHLDILVDGTAATVPGGIGVAGNTGISSLHSHQTDGIIHVEAPAPGHWTLGQFFTEWRVTLSQSCVGELCATADKPLRFYVNGQPYQGDPTQIELTAHGEIAIVYGPLPAGQSPPASYTFPEGD
jgi:hypothetical protein